MKVKRILALLAVLAILVGIFAMPAAAAIEAVSCSRCGSINTFQASTATVYYGPDTGKPDGSCQKCNTVTILAPRYRGGYVCGDCGNRYEGTFEGYGRHCTYCNVYYW